MNNAVCQCCSKFRYFHKKWKYLSIFWFNVHFMSIVCGWREPWIGRGCLGIWRDNTGLPHTRPHSESEQWANTGQGWDSDCEPLGQTLEPDIGRFVWGVSDNMMIADHQIAPSDIRQTDHHCQNNMQGTILRCERLSIPAIGDIQFPGCGIVN